MDDDEKQELFATGFMTGDMAERNNNGLKQANQRKQLF